MLDSGKVRFEIHGEEKKNATVQDLISHFSIKTDRMMLDI